MPYSILIFAYRLPSLTPSEFRSHWENSHIPLVKSIAGNHFPLSHTRRYIHRGVGGDDNSHPASVLVGTQQDFEYDGIAELMFEDENAFQTFFGIITQPEAAAKIAEDEEKFLDRKRMTAVVVGETTVTERK